MAKILIVDDEPSMLQVLKLNLELEGHETLLAADGGTAVKRVEAEEPDLILLDIMMPVMDGWRVLATLSMMELRHRPRIIVMTAKAGGHDLIKGVELGADEYVTKPFELDDLMTVVDQVLSRTPEEVIKRRSVLMSELS